MDISSLLVLLVSCAPLTWAGRAGRLTCPATTRPTFSSSAEVLAYLQVAVVCNTYDVEVTMDACSLLSIGFTATTDVAVGSATATTFLSTDVTESTCLGYLSGNNVIFTFNLTVCSPEITLSGTTITYTHTVRSFDQQVTAAIDRNTPLFVTVSCEYSLTMQKSLNNALTPVYFAAPVQIATQNEEYRVYTALFTDDTFLTPLSRKRGKRVEIKIPDTLYLGMAIDTDENYLVLEAMSCWATPSKTQSDSNRYNILVTGCPTEEAKEMDLVNLHENFMSSTVKVAFQSFGWSSLEDTMYIHCEVTICDWVLDSTCLQKSCSAKSIKKRAKDDDSIIKKVLTLGPIDIKTKGTKCGNNNGACSHICTEVKSDKKCLCPINWHLATDELRCKGFSRKARASFHPEGRMSVGEKNELDDSTLTGFVWILVLMVFAILGVVIMVVFVQTIVRRDKGRRDL